MPARYSWFVTTLAFLGLTVSARSANAAGSDFSSLTLEQLMQEPVTSVSKKATRLSDAAAAIFVVTQDDIRRLGIATLPDALRLVPGLDVAQVTANSWAISARGFNDQSANKLLVLIDGRTVYTPGTSSVYWNAQDVMIEDVERIEVIRGPGATLWGANAVNGVINVITRSARETQGWLITGAAGNIDDTSAAARYGGQLSSDLAVRAYLKYLDQGSLSDSTRTIDTGNWRSVRGGFRGDWDGRGAAQITIQGDIYGGSAGHIVPVQGVWSTGGSALKTVEDDNGSNILGRWTHTFSPSSAFSLQAYFDRIRQGYDLGSENLTTYDVEWQHGFAWAARSSVIWGGGYRYSVVSEAARTAALAWLPWQRDIHLFNLFVQDEIAVIPDLLNLTLGSKFEHNSLVGWNVEPNLRLAIKLGEAQTLWLAASRATRTPSVFELDASVDVGVLHLGPASSPVEVSVTPNAGLHASRVDAYELGYRFSPGRSVSLDFAGFFNRYRDEIVAVPQPLQANAEINEPSVLLPFLQQNALAGQSYGAELAAHWQVSRQWQVAAGYSWLHMEIGGYDRIEDQSPQQQFQLRTYVDLPRNVEVNAALSYVSHVSEPAGIMIAPIPSYVRTDIGISWRLSPTVTLGVWGKNLFERQHLEFANQSTTYLTEIPRSVYGKVTWSF